MRALAGSRQPEGSRNEANGRGSRLPPARAAPRPRGPLAGERSPRAPHSCKRGREGRGGGGAVQNWWKPTNLEVICKSVMEDSLPGDRIMALAELAQPMVRHSDTVSVACMLGTCFPHRGGRRGGEGALQHTLVGSLADGDSPQRSSRRCFVHRTARRVPTAALTGHLGLRVCVTARWSGCRRLPACMCCTRAHDRHPCPSQRGRNYGAQRPTGKNQDPPARAWNQPFGSNAETSEGQGTRVSARSASLTFVETPASRGASPGMAAGWLGSSGRCKQPV